MNLEEYGITWSDELSSFDQLMFRADGDAHSRTTMMFIELIDSVPDHERLRDDLDRASRVIPRLRQHVVEPLVPIAAARWVIDPDFDLDHHLWWVSLPAPGDLRHLLDFAQGLHARPLDPGRPLWEVTVVEGLDEPGTPAALCWKLSHAVADGMVGMVLDQMIRSDEREPDRGPMPPIPAPEDLSPLELTRNAVRGLPLQVIGTGVSATGRALSAARNALTSPSETASALTAGISDVRKLTGSPPTEPSPLLARRSLNRRYEAHDVGFAELRSASKSHGFSLNDAYLAALGEALGRYHREMGVPVDSVSTAMPVSIRSAENKAANQWSAVMIALPTDEADPVARMRRIREQVISARSTPAFDPIEIVAPAMLWLPSSLFSGVGVGSLGIDVQASNVPGHPGERYLAGAKILRNIPLGPLPGVAMMSTMMTASGRCHIGVHYDTASVTDGELFARCLHEGFDDVLAAGSAEPDTKSTNKKTRRTTKSPGEKISTANPDNPDKPDKPDKPDRAAQR